MGDTRASDRQAVRKATQIAAETWGVFRPLLLTPTRGSAAVAMARQVSQYLAHCSGGVPLTRLARIYRRNITTLTHNVGLIEDWRDAPEFDELMETLERKFDGKN